MTRIVSERNAWRNTVKFKCLDCGAEAEIKSHALVRPVSQSWGHGCDGVEILGQEIKP